MNRSPLKFSVLVFTLSIPIWLIEPRDWPVTASVGAPLMAVLILVYREEGLGGIRRLLRRIIDQGRIRKSIWYAPIIFLMPVVFLLTYGVMRLEASSRVVDWSLITRRPSPVRFLRPALHSQT
jgi:uncharacterized protein